MLDPPGRRRLPLAGGRPPAATRRRARPPAGSPPRSPTAGRSPRPRRSSCWWPAWSRSRIARDSADRRGRPRWLRARTIRSCGRCTTTCRRSTWPHPTRRRRRLPVGRRSPATASSPTLEPPVVDGDRATVGYLLGTPTDEVELRLDGGRWGVTAASSDAVRIERGPGRRRARRGDDRARRRGRGRRRAAHLVGRRRRHARRCRTPRRRPVAAGASVRSRRRPDRRRRCCSRPTIRRPVDRHRLARRVATAGRRARGRHGGGRRRPRHPRGRDRPRRPCGGRAAPWPRRPSRRHRRPS